MPRSARWLTFAGYAALIAGFAIGDVVPRGGDELGIANAMIALGLGVVLGAVLLLAGLFQGMRALLRARGRVRWFDYAILAAALAPFIFVAASLALPD